MLGALVLAGTAACGGGTGTDEATTTTDSWAGDVCAALSQWRGELATARSSLADPANLSAAELESAVADVEAATEGLADDLDALGAPDTEAGQWAQEQLGALSDQLSEQRQVITEALEQEPAGLAQVLDSASAVTAAAATMLRDTRETLEGFQQAQGDREQLSQAFTDAPECQDLRTAP